MNFPATTRVIQTPAFSIAVLPDGTVYRITESGYPFKHELLLSQEEWAAIDETEQCKV